MIAKGFKECTTCYFRGRSSDICDTCNSGDEFQPDEVEELDRDAIEELREEFGFSK